jgi:hypothetical protein
MEALGRVRLDAAAALVLAELADAATRRIG